MLNRVIWEIWRDERGQDLVEYSLLLAFIALAAVAILNGVGGHIRSLFTGMSNALVSASTAAASGAS